MKLLSKENRKKYTHYLFYFAWTLELVLMIVEKSEIPFSQESYVFRITFVLTFLAVLFMEHDKREWILIAVLLAISFFAYRYSGKNDLLRFTVFVMAARDLDLKWAMKYTFWVCSIGFGFIILLSLFGVLGDVSLTMDFGRGADEVRYVLGFGHPNTLFSGVYVLLLMWLWLYGGTAGIIGYLAAAAVSIAAALITVSRTGLVITVLTLFVSAVFRVFGKLKEKGIVYILEIIVSPVMCVATAILAAGVSEGWYAEKGIKVPDSLFLYYWMLEQKLNFRISSIYYAAEGRDAVLSRWQLFAGHDHESFFDMGWVRLFYWYGIIPTAIIILAILAVIFVCYRKKDIQTMVLIFSLSIYTVIEATFVTRYFGRDFFILIMGVYLGIFFRKYVFKIKDNEGMTDVTSA